MTRWLRRQATAPLARLCLPLLTVGAYVAAQPALAAALTLATAISWLTPRRPPRTRRR